MIQYILGQILLSYILIGILAFSLSAPIGAIRGKQYIWKNYFRDFWLSIKIGLLWPYYTYKGLVRVKNWIKSKMSKTYKITRNGQAIKCLICNKESHNPNDVANLYCGWCHQYHDILERNQVSKENQNGVETSGEEDSDRRTES